MHDDTGLAFEASLDAHASAPDTMRSPRAEVGQDEVGRSTGGARRSRTESTPASEARWNEQKELWDRHDVAVAELRELVIQAGAPLGPLLRGRSKLQRLERQMGKAGAVRQRERLCDQWRTLLREDAHDTAFWLAAGQRVADLVKAAREEGTATELVTCGAQWEILEGPLSTLLRRITQVRNRLIASNQGLVAMSAQRLMNRGLSFDDLMQEGNLGLVVAMGKFEASRGFRFSTYARWWIRQSMQRAIDNQSRTVRLPVHRAALAKSLGKYQRELTAQYGRPPTSAELSDAANVTIEAVEETLDAAAPLSLDAPKYNDARAPMHEVLAAEGASPDEQLSSRQDVDTAQSLLRDLAPRERTIIELRYGFGESNELTYREIGERLSLSRERIRQIELGALRKLRASGQLAI